MLACSHTFARQLIVFGLLALASLLTMGNASAADKGTAFAGCRAWIAENEPFETPGGYILELRDTPLTPTTGHCQVFKQHSSWNYWIGPVYQLHYDTGCPSPTTWDAGTLQCFNGQECLAKNDALGNSIQSTDTDTHDCDNGCGLSMGTNYTTTTLGGHTVFTGMMRYTGQACGNTNPRKPPNDPEPECRDIEGMSVCKRPDNKLCAKASNGNYVCWNPGETGEKTEGPTKQKRDAGPNPIPPNLNLPNGDTLTQQAPPVVTTETKPGKPNITTNITNYNTTNGSDAGPTNQGEGGEGEEGEEDGEEEGKDGPKLSGGTDCNVPPVCDVVDDASCKSGIISWRFMCEASIESGTEVSEALAQIHALEASWNDDTQQYTDGAIQRYNEAREAIAAEVVEVESGAGMLDGLDDSGFLGAGQCPADIPLNIGPLSTGISLQLLCDFLGNIGLLVEAFAYFAAIRILTGVR